jgi:Zn-dependent protease with chaperone function
VRYWVLAASSAFSAFAIFAMAGSAIARLAGRIAAAGDRRAPADRARRLFLLRVLPAIAAATAAFGIALPIFLWFEERGTHEAVSVTMAAVAIGGGFLLARGAWRAAAAYRSSVRFVRDWQMRGRRIDELDLPMPAFAVDESFPIVAVAGILRPRLFIAERVLRECTAGEIAAMVMHESAHVAARDNVKRLLIRACPDALGTPVALDRAWSAAAEEAADAAAAGDNPSVRLDLAQALIHVARLATPRAPQLASAFYLGGSIDARVRRLVDPPADSPRPRWTGIAAAALTLALVVTVVLAAPALHRVMESAVRLLP